MAYKNPESKSDDAQRADALMIIIQKMVFAYQRIGNGNMDYQIFQLFKKANLVQYAKYHNSLIEAIENI